MRREQDDLDNDPAPKDIRIYHEKFPNLFRHFQSMKLVVPISLTQASGESILEQLKEYIDTHCIFNNLQFTSPARGAKAKDSEQLQYEKLPWWLLIGGNQPRQRDSQLVHPHTIQTYGFTIPTLLKVASKLRHPILKDMPLLLIGMSLNTI